MNSGVDLRIHDSANQGMPEIKREFMERWSIWGNCVVNEIVDTVFVCGKDTYDTITLSNKLQDLELRFPLVNGTYDSKSDKMIFTLTLSLKNNVFCEIDFRKNLPPHIEV